VLQYSRVRSENVQKALLRKLGPREQKHFKISLARSVTLKTTLSV